MSLQEAASSGSFGPRAPQPTDPQRADTPFHPPLVDSESTLAEDQANTPFSNPYAFSAEADESVFDGGHGEMRAKRRRAWTVVSLAIVVRRRWESRVSNGDRSGGRRRTGRRARRRYRGASPGTRRTACSPTCSSTAASRRRRKRRMRSGRSAASVTCTSGRRGWPRGRSSRCAPDDLVITAYRDHTHGDREGG